MSKVTVVSRPNRITIASKGVQGAVGPEGPQGEHGERGPTGDVTPEAIAARDAAVVAASAAAQSASDAAAAFPGLDARVTELEENPAFPDAPDDGGAYIRVNGQWVQLYAPLALSGDLPDGTVDEPYSATLTAAGGRPPYALGDVLLPPGLDATLADATVTVAGTPSEEWEGDAHIDLSDSLGTAIRRVLDVRVNAAPFNPATLFADGSPGDYWDNLAPDTFFQDSTATTPNAASGEPCGHFAGQRGNHWLQATSGARPTYMVEGGLKFVRFSGTNQFMQAASLALAGATKATMILGIRQRVFGTSTGAVLENGSPISAGGGIGGYINNGSPSGSFGAGMGSSGNYVFKNAGGATFERKFVASIVFDPAAASAGERVQIRMDGAAVNETQPAGTGTPTDIGISRLGYFLASRAGTSLFSGVDFFCGILVGGALDPDALADAEEWCALRTGTALAFASTPTHFSETGITPDRGTHLEASPFAVAKFATDATVIEAESFNNIHSSFPSWAKLEVMVDGVLARTFSPAAEGVATERIYLPPGEKVVDIVSGLQSRPSATVRGTWLRSLRANGALVQLLPPPVGRVLFYGDSITVGANSDAPATQACAMLVRAAYAPGSVAVEGYGYRSLNDDASDGPGRAAFVAKVVAYAPERIWLAIGTNDYGLNRWTAAAFGASYSAMLDDLKAALPSVTIFCQTPLVRAVETANGSGSTMGDFRAQIATAVSTRGSYATLVDGTAILTTEDLADGVHPTTAGHAKYANAVKAVLGIV